MAVQATPQLGRWTTGLCGCFEDCCSCWCAWCCPCVTVGQVANILDNGHTSCFEGACIFCLIQYCLGLGCLYTCGYRKKLRARFDLPPDPCNDCCTDCWCLCCSVAQQYRELKNRDMDPSLGYGRAAPRGPPANIPPTGQFMSKG